MRPKRTDLKPADVVRCRRCGHLVEKVKATRMNGSWYGSDCLQRVISTATADPSDR